MKRNIKKLNYLNLCLVVVLAMLAGACGKISYHQLSDSDMEWLVYDNNEVDVFTNGSNQSVSYHVALRLKSYQGGSDHYNEFTTAAFQLLNDSTAYQETDSKGELYIFKQDDDALLVTLSWPHYPILETPLTSLEYNVVTIAGITYEDVFILDATGATDSRFYIEKIWYSQKAGVIQYEDIAGDLWIRNN